MKTEAKHLICKAVFLIVFFSVAFYGGGEVWFETLVFSAVFVAAGLMLFWKESFARLIVRNRGVFLPLALLAAYSFLQTFSTLLIQHELLDYSFLFPYSFDLTASFRSGLKIFAFACFIGLFLESLRRDFHFSVWSLIGAGNFFALLGIARFALQAKYPDIFQIFLLPELTPGDGFGPFVNQNHFALLMLMTFGLNIGFCWLGKFDRQIRVLLLVLSLMSWTAIVLTASRGGILGSFIVVGALVILSSVRTARNGSKKRRFGALPAALKNLLIFVFISGVLILGVVLVGQDRVLHRFHELPDEIAKAENLQGFRRIDAWRAGLGITRENWLYGVGFGGYRYAVSQHINISGRLAPEQAHNDYLEFINSGGLVALLLAAWFLYHFFSTLKKRFDEPENNFVAAARVGAVCGLAGLALHSFFDFGLQFTGNLLFFAALIGIAIHRPVAAEDAVKTRGKKLSIPGKTAVLILISVLAAGSALFAYSRFDLQQAKNGTGSDPDGHAFGGLPFDADYFETRADAFSGSGNYEMAADELETAIFYRPKDHKLWLKLARLEQALKRPEAAEKAFRQAVTLAPLYGEPHFEYGRFLIENNRTEEGFKELSFAFHRDARYSDPVIETVWKETGEDILRTFDLLAPLGDTAEMNLARFLMSREAFAAIAELDCKTGFSPYLRHIMVIQLLEKKRYRTARQIEQTGCGDEKRQPAGFIDGGFEDGELRRGIGFGWRVGDAVEREHLFFDEENPAAGRQSLRFTLEGDFKTPLISQIIPVEKGGRYKLKFSYKTEGMTAGAFPAAQFVLKEEDAENELAEIELKKGQGTWTAEQIEFETNERAEAFEVRLSTRSCGQPLCPIYGTLWIDDFQLSKANK